MTNQIADYVEVELASTFTPASDTTVDLVVKNDIYGLVDQKTASIFQTFRLSIFEKTDKSQKITVAIDGVVANGTLGGKNRYTATIDTSDGSNPMIGIANTDDGTDADANIIAGNVSSLTITEFSTGSTAMVKVGTGEYNELKNQFTSNTTTKTITSGEAFDTKDQLSLHSDGKHYKYHATNYPNWQGTAGFTATAADETGTMYLPGYLVPGYSGLTLGTSVYAEETGDTTQTPSTTTYFIGKAESATEVRLQSSADPTVEASQAQAEAGAVAGVFNSPLRTAQQIAADTGIVHTTGAETVAGVKTFSSSPIVPAPTTDLQAATKQYVDDAIVLMDSAKIAVSGTLSSGGAFTKVVAHGMDSPPKMIFLKTSTATGGSLSTSFAIPSFLIGEYDVVDELNVGSGDYLRIATPYFSADATNITFNLVFTSTGYTGAYAFDVIAIG